MLAGVHRDKEHIHLHVAVSALKYRTGESVRMSHSEFTKLKNNFQKYHQIKYPEIKMSFPEHGKGKVNLKDRDWYAINKKKRDLTKSELTRQINFCLSVAKSKSEFYDMLLKKHIFTYERSGHSEGVIKDDSKFRFRRLGVDMEKINELPELNERDKKALDEIDLLRSRKVEDRDRGPDK